MLAIINEKLKLGHITKQHISVAHRVGQFSKGYQRQVIVRFVSRRHRIEVIQARRNLKGSGIAIVEDLTPLNKERLDRVSKHKAVKSTWTKDGRIFALLADKRVVKIEKGDLSKLPRELSEPPPRDSQAGSNHSDQHRSAHDVQSVSSRPTPSTPTACSTVSVGNETTPLSHTHITAANHRSVLGHYHAAGMDNQVRDKCMQSKMNMNRIRGKRRYSFTAVTDMPKPIRIPTFSCQIV